MYTGFSDATVNPPGLARVAPASVLIGTLPSEPSTSFKTWRGPLTQFLRAVVLQLLMRCEYGSLAAAITVFRFWAALFQKPNPRSCSPQLSRNVFLLTSSGEKVAPFFGSNTASGVPVPLAELTTSSRPASPVLVFAVVAFGLYSMPRRSEKY